MLIIITLVHTHTHTHTHTHAHTRTHTHTHIMYACIPQVGLEQLGVDVSNTSMVMTMMKEADIDGNNGIDFGEFKDVIFRVLDEEA